jgi:hypothetical protein
MKKLSLILGWCLFACTLHASIDLNYNGLSDVFEFIYFNGSAEPLADADGDGVSNYDEMVWGTNPTNAASAITAPTATVKGDVLQLTWLGAPNRYYELSASIDLSTWQVVTNGTVSSYTQSLAGASPASRFYRLTVSLLPGDSNGDGIDDWEEALYVQTFGVPPAARDSDSDGLYDLQEFQQGHLAGKKDHPAVGLVLYTPLEK